MSMKKSGGYHETTDILIDSRGGKLMGGETPGVCPVKPTGAAWIRLQYLKAFF